MMAPAEWIIPVIEELEKLKKDWSVERREWAEVFDDIDIWTPDGEQTEETWVPDVDFEVSI